MSNSLIFHCLYQNKVSFLGWHCQKRRERRRSTKSFSYSCIQLAIKPRKITFSAAYFGRRYKSSFVIVNMDAVLYHYQGKEPRTLDHQTHGVFIFDIENVGRVPVSILIDVTFRKGGHNKVIQSHRHVDNPIFKVQFLVDLVDQVGHVNLVFFI